MRIYKNAVGKYTKFRAVYEEILKAIFSAAYHFENILRFRMTN
jgi:hypothetical protein